MPTGKPGRHRKEQARRHEQANHQTDPRIVEAERIRKLSADRAHGLELKPQADTGDEQQRQDAPAHHTQPS
jgi:hypothetical protein